MIPGSPKEKGPLLRGPARGFAGRYTPASVQERRVLPAQLIYMNSYYFFIILINKSYVNKNINQATMKQQALALIKLSLSKWDFGNKDLLSINEGFQPHSLNKDVIS